MNPAAEPPLVVVHPDAGLLAAGIAARLLTALADAQAARGQAGVVLTGGGIGTAALQAVAASPARDSIEWRRVELWWGDERFVPRADPERNALGAWRGLLGQVDLDPARVHEMGATEDFPDVDAAAEAYGRLLAGAPPPDIVLLGVGPEAHVASLFPESPAVRERDRWVVSVHDCPKPPPLRTTLTLPAIGTAREVWLLAAGAAKAGAVRMALAGGGPIQVPAAGARGRERTCWLLDSAAAGLLEP